MLFLPLFLSSLDSNLCLCSQPEALPLCHFLSQLLLGTNTISSIYLKPDLLEEVWAISLIAVSSLFILCFLYCCQFLFLHLLYVFLHHLFLCFFFALDMFLSVTASLYFFFFFKFGCTSLTTLDILIQRPSDLMDMGIGEILQGAWALSVKDKLYIQLYMN